METMKKSEVLALAGNIKKVGNMAVNQFHLTMENGEAFQSYESLIAVKVNGRLYLTDKHDYSKTTSKYTTQWTGLDLKARRDGLKHGNITLID